jgi:hypothetical protein
MSAVSDTRFVEDLMQLLKVVKGIENFWWSIVKLPRDAKG